MLEKALDQGYNSYFMLVYEELDISLSKIPDKIFAHCQKFSFQLSVLKTAVFR
jgi:hypothetical protein